MRYSKIEMRSVIYASQNGGKGATGDYKVDHETMLSRLQFATTAESILRQQASFATTPPELTATPESRQKPGRGRELTPEKLHCRRGSAYVGRWSSPDLLAVLRCPRPIHRRPPEKTVKMRDLFGGLGKPSGLLVRILQCVFSLASAGVMVLASYFIRNTSFWCLALVMGVLFLWSLSLSCLDFHSIMFRRRGHSVFLLVLICIGDWVMTIISLGVACASAGVVNFLYKFDSCYKLYMPCNMYRLSIALAFVACFFIAISASVMFRLVVSSY
ncbi:PREDICTED: CASP-like protein 5B2 isoform X2 [Ipomoea nil]|uniref:CASP-like protein 5B2 isoform X2 n=1 Tax=Ipomoea nil TaxID=35883 RepID=UPI0009018096|nr:PREDICTED: CASP-like protein 5B2 isoform X2 [Ipomoea nil]